MYTSRDVDLLNAEMYAAIRAHCNALIIDQRVRSASSMYFIFILLCNKHPRQTRENSNIRVH